MSSYNAKELTYIQENYPVLPVNNIAKTLKRSVYSIRVKANAMGVYRQKNKLNSNKKQVITLDLTNMSLKNIVQTIDILNKNNIKYNL